MNADPYRCIPEDAMALHINTSPETLIILCMITEGVVDDHTSDVTYPVAGQTRLPLHKIIPAAQSAFAPSKPAFNGRLQPPSPRSVQDCDQSSHRTYREESSHHLRCFTGANGGKSVVNDTT